MRSSLKNIVNRVLPAAGAALALIGCANAPVKPQHVARGDYETARRYITQLIQQDMKKYDVTGLSIALVDDQKVVWAQGFGYADKAGNIAATPDTVYRVGSVTKLFTATAAMQLAEQGRLDIDKPLQSYLPEFSIRSRFPDSGPITPRNIMTHHSGLPSDFGRGMWNRNPEPFTKVAGKIKDEYVAYPPGFVWSYSNLGMTLLGHAVQQVAAEDYAALVEQSVLRPLGMTRSGITTHPEAALMAKAYHHGIETPEAPLRDTPAAGLNSSVLDMSRFLQMVFADGRSGRHQVLKPETIAEMLRPQNTHVALDQNFHMGLGWILGGLGGIHIENAGPVAHHGGATMLFRSQVIALPKHKLGVVVLANSSSAESVVDDVATEALKLALEAKTGIKQAAPLPAGVSESTLPRDVLQRFRGHYATVYGFAKVTDSGNGLRADLFGKSFDLVGRGNGSLGLQYKLFGVFPISLGSLAEVGLSRASVAGREVLLANTGSQRMLVGEKIVPDLIPENWMARVGDYEIMNGEGELDPPEKIGLRYRDGFLVVEMSMSTFGGMPITFAAKPLSDSELQILGLGRDMGGTIRMISVDGQERALYSGYQLRKKAK